MNDWLHNLITVPPVILMLLAFTGMGLSVFLIGAAWAFVAWTWLGPPV